MKHTTQFHVKTPRLICIKKYLYLPTLPHTLPICLYVETLTILTFTCHSSSFLSVTAMSETSSIDDLSEDSMMLCSMRGEGSVWDEFGGDGDHEPRLHRDLS